MFAIFQNELVLGGIIGIVVVTLFIWRFIGLKKFGRWLIGSNTPEARSAAKAKANKPSAD